MEPIDNALYHEQPASSAPAVDTVAEVLHAKHALKKCWLCGSRNLFCVGTFHPRHPSLWFGAPRPGVEKKIWYALCKPCVSRNLAAKGALVDEKLIALSSQMERGTRH